MKFSRTLMVLPFFVVLAACQTTGSASKNTTAASTNSSPVASTATSTTTQPTQAATVEVFAASAKKVANYRPVPLDETHTIYVSPHPIFRRTSVASVGAPVQDAQKNVYVRLNLKEHGITALKSVPKGQGFVTVIGGQVASLRGFRKDDGFYFQVRDEAAAQAITEAIVGQKTQ
ncbi:hypothetical protein [Pelistega europaea]|uniref:Lipoprotein n=1 Tax=Pelistega europaea TaxID=106147 RepID=A0A7Y4L9L2_9BURK|nr:hypothetical protein [Pelistega europaea]NOL49458.1 hypothetical protein [Pelistega europaea]